MFKFYLKKNFCDGWDNLFFMVLTNIPSIAVVVLSFIAMRIAVDVHVLLPGVVFVAAGAVLMMVVFAWGANAAKVAHFDAPTLDAFIKGFKYSWRVGLAFGAMLSVAVLVLRISMTYYITMFLNHGSILVGMLFAAVLGWFAVVCAISLQWFIPLYFLQEENTFAKCLKKSFIIFFDNPMFSIGVFLFNALLAVLSCCLFLFAPGFNGILLSSTNALRLRLYKYDWLEKMEESDPGFSTKRDNRAEVPWEELLAADEDALGPRDWKTFVFPWK